MIVGASGPTTLILTEGVSHTHCLLLTTYVNICCHVNICKREHNTVKLWYHITHYAILS